MLRIGNLPLPIGGGMDQLRRRAARELGVRPGALGKLEIVRQSTFTTVLNSPIAVE